MTRDLTARGIEPGTFHGVPNPYSCGGVTALRSHGCLALR